VHNDEVHEFALGRGSLWKSAPTSLAVDVNELSIAHLVDTEGGNSGGAIILAQQEVKCIAVHTYGGCEIDMSNGAIRITKERKTKILDHWNPDK